MRNLRLLIAAACAAPLLLSACASGPVIPRSPSVKTRLQSTVITPHVIKFVAKVVIRNRMGGPLDIQQVDYGAELHDQPLFESSFAKLHRMSAWGTQTVTLPFQVAMKDITDQIVDVLAEEGVRVTLRGTVVPIGFGPIAFTVTKTIPMPRLPKIAYDGSQGNPLNGEFTVFLRVRNTNDFPVTFSSVKTFLRLNGKKYDLLRSQSFGSLAAGERGRIALRMHKTRGKGLSMIVNMLENQSAEFSIGGAMTFKTPHGVFHLPVEISTEGVASPIR